MRVIRHYVCCLLFPDVRCMMWVAHRVLCVDVVRRALYAVR